MLKKQLRKILFLSFLVGFNQAFAQIKLKDDSVHPATSNNEVSKQGLGADKLKSLVGFGMYTATILGYAESCSLSKKDQQLIFDNYFNKLKQISLTTEEIKLISDKFVETAQVAKEKGVSNSNMTCNSFQQEFNKILADIKK